jgi:hypothetical protein
MRFSRVNIVAILALLPTAANAFQSAAIRPSVVCVYYFLRSSSFLLWFAVCISSDWQTWFCFSPSFFEQRLVPNTVSTAPMVPSFPQVRSSSTTTTLVMAVSWQKGTINLIKQTARNWKWYYQWSSIHSIFQRNLSLFSRLFSSQFFIK